jgi:hypothetical protein
MRADGGPDSDALRRVRSLSRRKDAGAPDEYAVEEAVLRAVETAAMAARCAMQWDG